jgi:hypothetical protein
MTLSRDEILEVWDQWIGSPSMEIGLKRPINFLGSIVEHKKKFMEVIDIYIEEKSKNELIKKEKDDIIRKNQVLINLPCNCDSGCNKCGGTMKQIKYVEKIRH